MDIQPKLGGVVKLYFHYYYKIYNLRYDALKFGRKIQGKPTNNIMMNSFKIIHSYNTS